MAELSEFSDQDFKRVVVRALRLTLLLTAVALPLVWWRLGGRHAGWRSAALLLVGAAISASGLWEWLRLLTAVMARMEGGGEVRPMGLLLVGFFLRLAVVVTVLYVSLKYLEGSVIAVAIGLGLGIVALTVEGLRLVKSWTM